jgi:hypothetical protein
METPLNIIYTYQILGELDLLPRLHTFIQSLKHDLDGRTIIADLGESCAPHVWPCDVTAGRSTLVALDAMGYNVANVQSIISAQSRNRLVEQVMLGMVDDDHPYVEDGLVFVASQQDELRPHDDVMAYVVLHPEAETQWKRGVLTLQSVEKAQVGVVRIEDHAVYRNVYTLPANTAPNPTIAGTVDFVRDEARYYQKRLNKSNGKHTT